MLSTLIWDGFSLLDNDSELDTYCEFVVGFEPLQNPALWATWRADTSPFNNVVFLDGQDDMAGDIVGPEVTRLSCPDSPVLSVLKMASECSSLTTG